ncbi:MAG: radical SAM protein [PVC group bacterium]|nr:radical SAM protein [PVC group bacterium]
MIESKQKINKILLIFPAVIFSGESPKQIMPPLGISYLAAYLRPDYEVKLLDAAVEGYNQESRISTRFFQYGLDNDHIRKRIIDFAPDVVGVSCLFSSQFLSAASVCAIAKNVSPEIVTVMGGTHPTFLSEQCLADRNIDFIVRGEGERTFKELLDCLRCGQSFKDVGGIAFRQDNLVRINPAPMIAEDIDRIPVPARDLLPLEKYFQINMPMGLISRQTPAMNMITSRGCSFDCSFCSSCHFWGRRYRPRLVENVLDEMEQLKDMGIKELKFFDDNLTLDRERAKKLFRGMIARKFNFSWNTPNGIAAQTLDEEMVLLMKESGCYEITLAVESGDEQILRDVLKKPINLKHTLHIAEIIKNCGIDTYGFFIIGFPQETKKQIYNTLHFMDKIRLDRISLFIANPLPGTEIYRICREKGYLSGDFEQKPLDYFQSVFQTPEFDSKFLESTRRRWYWRYNSKLLLRNPFKFFRKYSIFIFKRPLFLLRIIINKLIVPSLNYARNQTEKK